MPMFHHIIFAKSVNKNFLWFFIKKLKQPWNIAGFKILSRFCTLGKDSVTNNGSACQWRAKDWMHFVEFQMQQFTISTCIYRTNISKQKCRKSVFGIEFSWNILYDNTIVTVLTIYYIITKYMKKHKFLPS